MTVTPLFLFYCVICRAVYVLCHTYTHTQRGIVYVLPSLLSLPLPPFFLSPPSLQDWSKFTALIYASMKGHTAAVKAIVAADPHWDHIRMTDVRYAGRREGSVRGTG